MQMAESIKIVETKLASRAQLAGGGRNEAGLELELELELLLCGRQPRIKKKF